MAKAIPHSYSSVPTIAHLISTYLSPPTESSLSVGLKVDIYFFLITQVRCIHRKFEKRKEIDMKKNHLPSLNQVVIFKKVSDRRLKRDPKIILLQPMPAIPTALSFSTLKRSCLSIYNHSLYFISHSLRYTAKL